MFLNRRVAPKAWLCAALLCLCAGDGMAHELSSGTANAVPAFSSKAYPVAVVGREYRYAPIAHDADSDALELVPVNVPAQARWDGTSLSWRPLASDLGISKLTLRARDEHGATTEQSFALRVLQTFCPIMPIAIPHDVLVGKQPGDSVEGMPRGDEVGNFGWMSWTGEVDAATLAASLAAPGNSDRYINPQDASDRRLDIGDWAQSSTGSMNTDAVRAAMDLLKQQDIILPVWGAVRGQGSRFEYRVQRFITVRLLGYQLTGNGWLSFQYKGDATCYNRPPLATAQEVETLEDTALPILLGGSDPDTDLLSFRLLDAPVHGTLQGTPPDLVYVPDADFHGVDGFSFVVQDGELSSAAATVSIDVLAVNDAPVARAQMIEAIEDTALGVLLDAEDVDGDALGFVIASPPQHGTLSGVAPALTYTPNTDFHGADSFSFVASDGMLDSAAVTVQLHVMPVNDAPIGSDASVALAEDDAISITLAGSDVDGDPLSFSVVSAPTHGTLSGQAPQLIYTPTPDYFGVDSFQFQVSDGSLQSAPATVSVAITAVNDAPTAVSSQIELAEDGSVTFTAQGHDPDGDALSYQLITPPQHGVLSGDPPNWVYTPEADFHGSDSWAFVVSDGQLSSPAARIDVSVSAVNDAPTAIAQALNATVGVETPVTLQGHDIDSVELAYSISLAPTQGVLSGEPPNLIYTANADAEGEDHFTFVVHDGELESAAAEVRLTLEGGNRPPVIVSLPPVRVLDEGSHFDYPVQAVDPDLDDEVRFGLRPASQGKSLDPLSGALSWQPAPGYTGSVRADHIGCRFEHAGGAALPDLALFDLEFDADSGNTISVVVKNRGLVATQASNQLDVYRGHRRDGGSLLGTLEVPPLEAGEERRLVLPDVAIDDLFSGLALPFEFDIDLPFADDFDDGDAGGWTEMRNHAGSVTAWTVVEGVYQSFDGGAAMVGDTGWSDYDAQIRIRYPIGSSNDAALLFRVVDGYNWYQIRARNGQARLMGYVNGSIQQLAEAPVRMDPNTWYTLRAELRGSRVRAFVDGALLFDYNGMQIPRGAVGVEQDGRVHVQFDNLQVTPPLYHSVDLYAEVDQAATTAECVEDNNSVAAALFAVHASDRQGLFDTQHFSVGVRDVNEAPQLETTELLAAVAEAPYLFDVVASDPDIGDGQLFSLLDGPAGMQIDPVSGVLSWIPSQTDLGNVSVLVAVSDLGGLSDERSWTLRVLETAGPYFVSEPLTMAEVDVEYRYAPEVRHPELEAVSFGLLEAPVGMQIDAETGQVRWTPDTTGTADVAIAVQDARGRQAIQAFSIVVTGPGGEVNRVPSIDSEAPTRVRVGQTYSYVIQASDPDGDVLQFRLLESPSGMQIDAASGLITFIPTAAQLGDHLVSVRADDGRGGSVEQRWTLQVLDAASNRAPQITSTPLTAARVGVAYAYQPTAQDADGDVLSWTLPEAPAGMSIDAASGRISYTPTEAGAQGVRLRVSDGLVQVDQAYVIEVLDADTPLAVDLTAQPNPVRPGGELSITVAVRGAIGPISLTATLDGAALSLQPEVPNTVTAPTAEGTYVLAVSVSDGSETVSETAEIVVSADADIEPPTVSLLSPAPHPEWDAVEITAPTAVTGSVLGDDVARWTLSVREQGSSALRLLAEGSAAFEAQAIAEFDPTLLMNGQYVLTLQAWDATGNHAADSRNLMLTGDMKLGHFSVSFEEVSIPVAGIPVTVTRTYDTRRAHESLDFGYGWTVDANSMRVQESRRPGLAWQLVQEGGTSGQACVRPLGSPIVTVRLPDGELAKFKARAEPECSPANQSSTFVELKFDAIDGTDSTLEQADYGTLRLRDFIDESAAMLVDELSGDTTPADPSRYVLTTPEGMVFQIDQGFGLKRVDDEASGEHLTFSRDGVLHSSGVGIFFDRDPSGRIRQMQLPDGTTRDYTYTPTGDLGEVIDQVDEITSFGYVEDVRYPHYLEDIIDPRGVRVSRNEYDDDGRLVAAIDADGHRIEYTHDISDRIERIKDRRGHITTYLYDEEGRVLAETNAEQETTLRTYDDDGNERTTTNAMDETTTRTFDGSTNLLTEKNHAGEVTTYTYNHRNQLETQVDDADRPVLTNQYNAYNGLLLVTSRDALGNPTQFAYEGGVAISSTGRLIQIADATEAPTRFEYHPSTGYKLADIDALNQRTDYVHDDMGRLLSETRTRTLADGSTESLVTRYDYDDKGRVIAVEHPDGGTTTTRYDGNDKPIEECDALSRCTVTTYDPRGNVSRIDYPGGTFETKTYDANGNLETETDRGGRTTRYVYDKANRLIETILPDDTADTSDNPRTRTVYDDAGRVIEGIDELGRSTQYRYDAAGRQTEVIQVDPVTGSAGAGPVMRTLYDNTGRRIASIDPHGNQTRYVHDAAGRLIETVFPDPEGDDGDDANNPRTRTDYDAVGRKIAESDEAGRTTRYAYDALGRLVAVVLPNPETGANPELVDVVSSDAGTLTTTYGYDEVGNKIRQTDAEGRTTRWEYDAMGRETARILPEGQRETKRYNEAGELVEATDFNGVTTRYAYDTAGRLDTIDYAHDADVSTTYTDAGERASVTDGRGESTWQHDARGRVLQSRDADGHIIEYEYDDLGNLKARISPSQSLVYEHDALNRIVAVTRTVDGEAPTVTRYEYDDAGNRKAMLGGDGTRTDYGYDARHRLRSLVKTTALGVLLVGMSYDVDATGMRTAVEEYDAAGVIRTVGYAYDGVKRLVEERIDHRVDANDRTSVWTYDRVGNRLTQSVSIGPVGASAATTTYGYDDNDRLLSETQSDGVTQGVTTYTYDDNGNTKTKQGPDGDVSYTYDDANRLVEATTPDGVTSYVYNADGLRVRQSVTPGSGPGVGQTTTTWYVQDSGYAYAQVIEQYTSVGGGAKELSATFTFADDLVSQTRYDESGTPSTAFVQMDGFGSTRWVTDENGQITDEIDYDAFGNEILRTGTTEVEHLYRSERWDANVGAYDLRARLYTSGSGRFLTQDSFVGFNQDPRSLHKYLYVHADPVNLIDPSGNSPFFELLIGVDFQQGARVSTAQTARWAFRKVLFGNPPKEFGIVGEWVIDYIIQSASGTLLELSGTHAQPSLGTQAHLKLEDRLEEDFKRFKRRAEKKGFLLPDVEVKSEVFRLPDGTPAPRRGAGTVGLDIVVYHKGKPMLAFDLKTGAGFKPTQVASRVKAFGTSIIQVTVKPMPK